MKITKIYKPVWNKDGTIDCEFDHPVYGRIPFTANKDDVEQHGRDIFALAAKTAKPYVETQKERDFAAQMEKEAAVAELASTDWQVIKAMEEFLIAQNAPQLTPEVRSLRKAAREKASR